MEIDALHSAWRAGQPSNAAKTPQVLETIASMKKLLHAGIVLAALGLAVSDSQAATLQSLTSVQFVTNVKFREQLNAAIAMNVKIVRIGLRWTHVEKVKGRYDWSLPDSYMLAFKKAGITPIITLFGANKLYRPVSELESKAAPYQGDSLQGFADFSAAVVARYGAEMSGRPILYEIWNEPNTKTFWGLPPEPSAYAAMAEAACTAMKASNSDATILGLAMEGTPVKQPYFVPAYGIDIYQQWADLAATPGLMGCVDGISMHPYRGKPETYLDDEPQLAAYLGAHWTKPDSALIANTEWGYTIDLAKGRDASVQASLMLRTVLVGTGHGRVTNLFQSVDTGVDNAKPDQTFGLFDYAGEPKPSGSALKRLIDAIGDFDIDGVEQVTGMDGIYRFSAHRGGQRAVVLWSTGEPVDFPAESLKVGEITSATYLVSGNELPGDARELRLTLDPILLITQ